MLRSTSIPIEHLISLQNELDNLPSRDGKRRELVAKTADFYGVSESTVRRELRNWNKPTSANRKDYNQPRIVTQNQMELYWLFSNCCWLNSKQPKAA